MQAQIKELSDKRQELWKQYQDSWVQEAQKYSMEEPKEIDILGAEILRLLQQHHKELPVDFIIEELTKLGQAPNVIYDDNGHFAITADGYATVSDEPQDAEVYSFVRKSQWKRTIREALEYYMFNRDEDLDVLPDDFFIPFEEQ